MAFPPRFTVRRSEPVLVAPAKPTTNEFKPLSDIDDQQGLRFLIPTLHFYRGGSPSMGGRDPARVIREALAKALVFFYPFAGRLREGLGGKLVVECTGEGVLFVEAEADVRLDQFGDTPRPPFPCAEDLIPDVDGSGGVLHFPLLLIQVTRLTCGGFIVGLRMNHTMCDAAGQFHLMTTIGEIARGADAPSVLPVWSRELLTARTPPTVTHQHDEYKEVVDISSASPAPPDPIVLRFFFFGPSEMSALRRRLHPFPRAASAFELLTACTWRCRTAALLVHPQQEVRTLFIVDLRNKLRPPLPAGYFGNAFAAPTAVSTAEKLCSNPLGYAVDLVRKAKAEVTAEYLQSVADLMVLRGRPPFAVVHTFLVSDLTRANFNLVDFGWGVPLFSGPANSNVSMWDVSFHTRSRNKKGEEGILVPLSLPSLAMERFVVEIENLTRNDNGPILSSL